MRKNFFGKRGKSSCIKRIRAVVLSFSCHPVRAVRDWLGPWTAAAPLLTFWQELFREVRTLQQVNISMVNYLKYLIIIRLSAFFPWKK